MGWLLKTQCCCYKEIHSQRLSFITEERDWRDQHFATNFMKIGGAVS